MSSQHCLRFNLSFVSFHSFLIAPFFIYIVKDVAASSFHWNFSLINTVGVLITLQSFLKLNAFRSLKVWDNDGLCGLGKMWKLVGVFLKRYLSGTQGIHKLMALMDENGKDELLWAMHWNEPWNLWEKWLIYVKLFFSFKLTTRKNVNTWLYWNITLYEHEIYIKKKLFQQNTCLLMNSESRIKKDFCPLTFKNQVKMALIYIEKIPTTRPCNPIK